jgi:NADPH:quinone reductase-like Zn-dependent oxidoreductase
VDLVIDTVGAAFWEKHARVLAPAGRCVIVGLMGGAKHEVDFGVLLKKRLKLMGLVMRTRALSDRIVMAQRFMEEVLPEFESGKLKPVIDSVWPLADASKAHARMEASAHIGKIMLSVNAN